MRSSDFFIAQVGKPAAVIMAFSMTLRRSASRRRVPLLRDHRRLEEDWRSRRNIHITDDGVIYGLAPNLRSIWRYSGTGTS